MEQALREKLVELGLTEDKVGLLIAEEVITKEDLLRLNAQEIKAITGCGLGVAKKVLDGVLERNDETALVAAGETALTVEVLPPLPEGDTSFLETLKTGGILKVEPIDVLAAVRAGLAAKIGVERIPNIILEVMEKFAIRHNEPVGAAFWEIKKIIDSRTYADVLAAIGVTGRFMNEPRKKEFLGKVNGELWKALQAFQYQLESWWQVWTGEMAATGMAAMALRDDDIAAELTEPPDTAALRAAAEAVINCINKVFAGTGIPVARALAWDVTKIKELLGQEGLPAAMGCTTKEQMLNTISEELGTSVEADYIQLELNVAKFILAIMNLKSVTPAQERKYLMGLRRLGKVVDWGMLGLSAPVSKGGSTSGSSSFRS